MANLYKMLVVSTEDAVSSFANFGKGRVLNEIEGVLLGLAMGSFSGSVDIQRDPAYASVTATFVGTPGNVAGVTIGGTSVTVTEGASDTASAALLAAAINANATTKTYVTAAAALGVVTITALEPGTMGNAIATVAAGANAGDITVATARLAGGTGGPGNSYTI
jgi:phage tail sheath gpL-like